MLVCLNTLSISQSPASDNKLNLSYPKDFFTLGSIWMPLQSVCYLVSCFDISLYGHTLCASTTICGKVITASARCPPLGDFIPLVCTVHEMPHMCTPLPSLPSFQGLRLITLQDLRLSIESPSNQFINYIPFPTDSLPSSHQVSITLCCN